MSNLSLDSEDEFPNDFDGFDFSAIPALQELPTNEPAHAVSPVATASPASTSNYDLGDEEDPSFLAAVDEIEARALRDMISGIGQEGEPMVKNSRDQSRKRCIEPSEESASFKKGKMKAEIQEDLQAVLEGYEDEILCPICCDILVAAHMASPCGHTYCGECGYSWLSRNKYSPTCAVCRTNLTAATPLLPNFVVDSIVRQHIQALATSGRPDWQENGYKLIEWNKRLEAWKRDSATRTAAEKTKQAARQRRHQPRYYIEDDDAVYVRWASVADDDDYRPRAGYRRRSRANMPYGGP